MYGACSDERLTFRHSFFSFSAAGRLCLSAYLAHFSACLLLDWAHRSLSAICWASHCSWKPYPSLTGAGDIQDGAGVSAESVVNPVLAAAHDSRRHSPPLHYTMLQLLISSSVGVRHVRLGAR